MMNRRIVIAANNACGVETCLQGFAVNLAIVRGVGCPGKSHDAAVIGRDRGLIKTDITEIVAQFVVAVDGFILLQETDAILRHKNPAWFQTARTTFIKRRRKQTLARTDRIGAVGDRSEEHTSEL